MFFYGVESSYKVEAFVERADISFGNRGNDYFTWHEMKLLRINSRDDGDPDHGIQP